MKQVLASLPCCHNRFSRPLWCGSQLSHLPCLVRGLPSFRKVHSILKGLEDKTQLNPFIKERQREQGGREVSDVESNWTGMTQTKEPAKESTSEAKGGRDGIWQIFTPTEEASGSGLWQCWRETGWSRTEQSVDNLITPGVVSNTGGRQVKPITCISFVMKDVQSQIVPGRANWGNSARSLGPWDPWKAEFTGPEWFPQPNPSFQSEHPAARDQHTDGSCERPSPGEVPVLTSFPGAFVLPQTLSPSEDGPEHSLSPALLSHLLSCQQHYNRHAFFLPSVIIHKASHA